MTEVRPLRAYAEIALGRQRAPQHEEGPHMVPYLRAANVKDGSLDLNDVKEMNFSPAEQKVFSLRPGDVLVTGGSGSLAAVGASAVWSGEVQGRVCFQNTLLRLRPRPGTDPRFLAWWCRYAFAAGVFASIATGANIYHVSAERVRDLPVTYRAPMSQRAIADFLDAETARIDALIARKRQLLRTIDERERAKAPYVLLGSRADERPVPGWEWIRARRLCPDITVGVVVDPSSYFAAEGMPFIHGTDVRQGWIDESNFKFLTAESNFLLRKSQLRAGDVIAMRVGEPGRAAVVPEHLAGANCASVLIFRRSARLASTLLAAFLNSSVGRSQIEAMQYGAAQGVLNVAHALELRVPVPPLEVQTSLVRQLENLQRTVRAVSNLLERQIGMLRERRAALITAAVTGELEIPGVVA